MSAARSQRKLENALPFVLMNVADLSRVIHEDLPGCPSRKSREEWHPVAKRREILSWFTKAPPGRAGFVTWAGGKSLLSMLSLLDETNRMSNHTTHTACVKDAITSPYEQDQARSQKLARKLLHQCFCQGIRYDIDVFSHHLPGFI